MVQVLLALRWYLVVQLFGLAALPLALRLFRHLPDRGYGVSKPLGLLLAGWVFWLLTTFGWAHNTAGGILFALALMLAAGLALQLTNQPTSHPTTQPPNHLTWHTIVTTEAVFALAFAAWCIVRAHMPRIETAGGEKWMEIAFLRAILRSDTFPPHDPWLSGSAISYYYFGYLIVAMLTRLSAIAPSVAFNLGIATLFALTCTGAYSLVYNLLAVAVGNPSPGPRRFMERENGLRVGALLGPLLMAVMGNLEGLLEVLHARGIGPAAFWQWLDVRSLNVAPPALAQGAWVPTRFFWWWQASRVISDVTPWGAQQEVIDEFPSFSFILGDMHPHVLALPFVLLALALALNLYLRISESAKNQRMANLRSVICSLRLAVGDWRRADFLVYALCLGGLGFLNTWDFPIYLSVVVAAYAIAILRNTQHASRFTFYVLRFALLFVALLLAGLLLYLPFWLGFQSQAAGFLPNLFNGTRLPQFLVMFGALLFIAVAFVVAQARQSGVRAWEAARWTLVAVLGVLVVLGSVLAVVVLLTWTGAISPQGPAAYLAVWLRGAPLPGLENVGDTRALISHSLLSRLLNPWTALGLTALLVAAILVLARRNTQCGTRDTQHATRDFVLLLFATGALLTLSVEYVYLRDQFGARMNTVFKFYFQAWVLWAVAGAYAWVDFIRRGRVGVIVVAALLVVAGLVYPILAIPKRAGEHGAPPTLDGAAYLAQVQPDDYAAIAWLNGNVAGAPVILEAPGDSYRAYTYEGRVSAHTGLPTLLGWAGHESQWRGNYDEQGRREPDIETLYTGTNLVEILTLLDKYDISYVYVGPLERARYPAPGLAKFADLMDVVYDGGSVTIYQRRPAHEQP